MPGSVGTAVGVGWGVGLGCWVGLGCGVGLGWGVGLAVGVGVAVGEGAGDTHTRPDTGSTSGEVAVQRAQPAGRPSRTTRRPSRLVTHTVRTMRAPVALQIVSCTGAGRDDALKTNLATPGTRPAGCTLS